MELRKLIRGTFALALICAALPAGAVGIKPAVVPATSTSKAVASKPAADQKPAKVVDAAPFDKSSWGAPPSTNYYGLPTSDSQRKLK